MNHYPLIGLLVLCLIGGCAALLAGAVALGLVLVVAAIISGSCLRQQVAFTASPPRPVITYLPQPVPHEPLVRLRRGQFVSVPWPHTLQVLLPEGTRLQILETTPDRIRVMAA